MPIRQLETLPPELVAIQAEVEEHAVRLGLDCYPTIFEMVSYDQLNEIAAYGGFPTRYPHWRFGMEYEQLSKGYEYGLQKIYEMVINNDPCYAYLLKNNQLTDQKLVMAHVMGHNDFFKNNAYFAHTNRKMMDQMANHGQRIRRYIDRFGVETVEEFIDACLSLEDLIDVHSPGIRRYRTAERFDFSENDDDDQPPPSGKFRAKDYMEPYVNPPDVLKAEAEAKAEQARRQEESRRFPHEPRRDVLLFLLEYAPLKSWQLDVLSIIRDEAYYYAPQGQTKIMNEGWASYWHSTMMTQNLLECKEVIDYADHHSGTMATQPGRLNPYKLGIELLRDIEIRWNRGQFGREYESCDDWQTKLRWDTGAGLGRQKIFEVRRVHSDLTFIDEFLTPEFCHQQKLFSYGYNDDADTYEIESRQFPQIKQRLLFSLTNMGRPIIQIRDGNFRNRGEMYLEHVFSGVGLRIDFARDTLESLHKLWKRPVHIETVIHDVVTVLSFDGHEHRIDQGYPMTDTERV
jgi:stage V sporulation protein R